MENLRTNWHYFNHNGDLRERHLGESVHFTRCYVTVYDTRDDRRAFVRACKRGLIECDDGIVVLEAMGSKRKAKGQDERSICALRAYTVYGPTNEIQELFYELGLLKPFIKAIEFQRKGLWRNSAGSGAPVERKATGYTPCLPLTPMDKPE